MKYVILILALLIGLPSIATADVQEVMHEMCSDNCSQYSHDVSCSIQDSGSCSDSWNQCMAECPSTASSVNAAHSADLGVQCTPTIVVGWMESELVDRRTVVSFYVYLWRCASFHYLRFGAARLSDNQSTNPWPAP